MVDFDYKRIGFRSVSGPALLLYLQRSRDGNILIKVSFNRQCVQPRRPTGWCFIMITANEASRPFFVDLKRPYFCTWRRVQGGRIFHKLKLGGSVCQPITVSTTQGAITAKSLVGQLLKNFNLRQSKFLARGPWLARKSTADTEVHWTTRVTWPALPTDFVHRTVLCVYQVA